MREIKTVTVVGANGTMGTNVSGIFASFGGAKVYMVCRDLDKAHKAVIKAAKSVRAESIKRNLIPADYSMLLECVAESDLVFESIAEDLEIKKKMITRIATSLRKDAIACSGTSGLSVTALAECFPEELRGNFFGVHMFNPPYSMTLCELVSTKYSDMSVSGELKKYLKEVLYRSVVEVKDSPAFLANRIGFQFINMALQYAEAYKDNGGVDYIDAILGTFTGRAMAPLATADFVGMDVHKAIVDNLYTNTNDYARTTFLLPDFAKKLIDDGKLGRKSGEGLYKLEVHENGLKRQLVFDINSCSYRDKNKYVFPFAEEMKDNLRNGNYEDAFRALVLNRSLEAEICLQFLLQYVLYSLSMARIVGFDITSADDVMATGFNWCPPLAMIKALSQVDDVRKLIVERLDHEMVASLDMVQLFDGVKESRYDYRRYFKSGR